MTASSEAQSQSERSVRLIHAAHLVGAAGIGIGLLLISRPSTVAAGRSPLIGYVFLGASLLISLVAILAIRPRVIPRASGQSAAEYWSTGRSRLAAFLLWAVTEMAAIVAFTGYFLTDWMPVLGAGLLAFAILAAYRPGSLAGG